MQSSWNPPSGWTRVTSLDLHAAGEPLRIITGGVPPVPGKTILAKRRFMQQNMDELRRAVMDSLPIRHPFEEDLGFLYGTIIMGAAEDPGHFGRNVCIFADGEVDRSPTGTGVSARAALHLAKGEIRIGEEFIIEGLLGTCFKGKALREIGFGPYTGVVPEVTGSAFVTGRNEFMLDPDDPLRHGFILR